MASVDVSLKERQANWKEREIELLITCLKSRPELIKGEITPNGKYQSTKQISKAWDEVANIISAEGVGVERTGKNAKKKWADLKCRTKEKLQKHGKERSKTGGGDEYKGKPLNDIDNLVLSLLGESSVYGLKGVDVFQTGGQPEYNQFLPSRPPQTLSSSKESASASASLARATVPMVNPVRSKKKQPEQAQIAATRAKGSNTTTSRSNPYNKHVNTMPADRLQGKRLVHSTHPFVNKHIQQSKPKSPKPITFRKHRISSPYSQPGHSSYSHSLNETSLENIEDFENTSPKSIYTPRNEHSDLTGYADQDSVSPRNYSLPTTSNSLPPQNGALSQTFAPDFPTNIPTSSVYEPLLPMTPPRTNDREVPTYDSISSNSQGSSPINHVSPRATSEINSTSKCPSPEGIQRDKMRPYLAPSVVKKVLENQKGNVDNVKQILEITETKLDQIAKSLEKLDNTVIQGYTASVQINNTLQIISGHLASLVNLKKFELEMQAKASNITLTFANE